MVEHSAVNRVVTGSNPVRGAIFLSITDCLSDKFSGDDSGRVTPVLIPNTEVKPSSADDT